jgi:hypothetical protein
MGDEGLESVGVGSYCIAREDVEVDERDVVVFLEEGGDCGFAWGGR